MQPAGCEQEDVAISFVIMYPGIDHINRYVSDVERHVAFYTEVMGYMLIDRGTKPNGGRYAILKGYEHELYISEKPRGEPVETALRHVGYAVEDVDTLLEGLKKSGIVGDETEIIVKEYSRQFYLRDPDGNEIDIIQWTDKEGFFDDLRSRE
jgi:catechol 2,3-dioxygenase-like lactoylglutathione lyase family enzyme